MKTKIFLILVMFLSFISCDEKTTIVEVDKNKIFARVNVTYDQAYYNLDSNKVIYTPTMNFEGEILGESITTIDSIFIGKKTFHL